MAVTCEVKCNLSTLADGLASKQLITNHLLVLCSRNSEYFAQQGKGCTEIPECISQSLSKKVNTWFSRCYQATHVNLLSYCFIVTWLPIL